MRKRRILYALILLASIASCIFYWDYIVVVLLILILAIPCLLFLLTLLARPFIRVRIENQSGVTARGKSTPISIEVDNSSIFHISNARLDLTIQNSFGEEERRESLYFPISSSNTTRLTILPLSKHCGKMTVCLKKLKLYDWLGLTGIGRRLSDQAEIAVLPEIYGMEAELPPSEAPDDAGNRYSNTRRGDDASQVLDRKSVV